jgi:hypothetical protein
MTRLTSTYRAGRQLVILLLGFLLPTACQDHPEPPIPDAATYSADVVTSWLSLQLKITQTTPASPVVTTRRLAYTGIALYESIVPGLVGYQSIAPQLNGLPPLPTVAPGERYHWPTCANVALAAMHRYLYPTTSVANRATIDSLETAYATRYQQDRPADELARSADFGRKIAAAIFEWSKSDGNDDVTPYTSPTGTGLWVPTPPAFATAALPNWGKMRPLVVGSDTGADQGAPTPYSTDTTSAYCAQAREVYAISQNLTTEQKATALFWADNPDGKSYGGGHWHAILSQVLATQKIRLDVAAVLVAQLGIAMSEASISIFKAKYHYNGLRPVTYIRSVLNQPDWNTLIPTPNHPEYPSGHSILSAAAAQTLTQWFGSQYAFTDHAYDALGFQPRSYHSFEEAAVEAGNSRVYAGIHYRKTCDVSQTHGKRIAQNVAQRLTFKK